MEGVWSLLGTGRRGYGGRVELIRDGEKGVWRARGAY